MFSPSAQSRAQEKTASKPTLPIELASDDPMSRYVLPNPWETATQTRAISTSPTTLEGCQRFTRS